MKKITHIALTTMLCIAIPAVNFGQTAPDLKSSADYAVLAATGISFAAPMNEINDLDIGLHPGFLSSITGLENLTLNNGDILAADQDPENLLPQAKNDLEDAYLFAEGSSEPAPATISGNQGGSTLTPGIYKSTSTLSIEDTPLTLDAEGDENAVWIFQISSSLTTTVGGNVILANGAKANNVYWQVGSSATIGNDTDFKGNILALVSISMNTGATIDGRLLASNGAVTFAGNNTMIKPCEDALISNFPTAEDVCIGEPYSIDFNSVVVENTIEEIWEVNPLAAGEIVNGIFTLNAGYVGQVNITLTAVAEIPCLNDQESLGFTVNTLPIVNISGETEFCVGESTVLTATAGESYLWSTGEITQSIIVSQAGNYSVVVTDSNGCEGDDQVVVSENPLPIVNISGETQFCQGGSTILTASAGVSYLWNTNETTQSITVSQAGNYSVVVTDVNGCEGDAQVLVTENPLPIVNISGETQFCQGGSTILTASVGVSYLWSTNETTQSITVSQAGSYSVVVTDENGCEGDDQVVVSENPLPIVNISGETEFCEGESTVLTASTGVSYSYLWNTNETTQSIIVSQPGNYSVVVTDSNGCEGDDQVVVTENPLPIVNISGVTQFCEGESTELTATAGDSYLWSTGETTQSITVSQAGNYSVVVTDVNGCEGEAQVSVSYLLVTIPSCPAPMNVLLTDDPVTLAGGSPGGGVYSGPGVTGTTFDPASAGLGEHLITYTIQDICGPQSCDFIIIVTQEPIICEDALISNFPTAEDVCEGDPYSIDFSSVLVENATEEIWEVSPIAAGEIVNEIFTLDAGYVGQVNITLTAIAVLPCLDAQESLSFTVNPIIIPTCPPNMNVLFTDDPVTLTGGTPEGGVYSGPGVTGNIFDPGQAGPGEHTITYTIQDNICGPQSCNFIITVPQESVPPIPIANWALFLTMGLMSISIFIFYRRIA